MLVEFWKRRELKLRRFIHNSLLSLNKAFPRVIGEIIAPYAFGIRGSLYKL